MQSQTNQQAAQAAAQGEIQKEQAKSQAQMGIMQAQAQMKLYQVELIQEQELNLQHRQ